MFYEYRNNEIVPIKFEAIDENKLTVGCINNNELMKYHERFEFSKNTVNACVQPSSSFRSGVEVYDNYTFTELKIVDLSNPNADDCVAIYIKKNLFIVVDVHDYDESTKNRFNLALKRYAPENTTLEKIIYAFLINLISRDNQTIETLDKKITELERQILSNDSNDDFSTALFEFKEQLSMLHNYYEQILDITEAIDDNENDILENEELHYISNITNKVIRLREDIDTLKNNITHLQDAYSTHLDLQLNKTMKVFTAVATIFLPLTLLTGWFGMNFTNMPSLNSPWGYTVCIALSVAIVIILAVLGKWKKWWG